MKPIPKQVEIKQGFYPSFIYLQPSKAIADEPYVQSIRNILVQSKIEFKAVEELHLSLSRTFYPIFTEIQATVTQCKMAVKSKKINLPIVLLFRKVQILQNFITLAVENITAERLKPITKQIEKIAKQPFYEQPIFHISLFKIESQISPQVLNRILQVKIEPKKSYILSKCLMRCGKVIYELHS